MKISNEVPGAAASAHMEDMTNQILIVGDMHANIRFFDRMAREAKRAGHSTIYQLGDLGAYWSGLHHLDRFTQVTMKILEKFELSMVSIDGNHDNIPAMRSLPLDADGFGHIHARWKFAPRGHRWEVAGRRFGALGGAVSVDQQWRTPGKDWWPEEATTKADVEALGQEKLDVLLSHEVPAFVSGLVSGMVDPLPEHISWDAWQNRLRIADAAVNTQPALIFSGHWHQRLVHQVNSGMVAHVLAQDNYPGNAVSLRLTDLSVTEFPIKPV